MRDHDKLLEEIEKLKERVRILESEKSEFKVYSPIIINPPPPSNPPWSIRYKLVPTRKCSSHP